jgi:hypothetical protein
MTQDEQDALLEILVETLGQISANVERLSRLLVESQERRGEGEEKERVQ